MKTHKHPFYAAELDAPPSDVVPDLIYTQHYGF